MKTTWTLNEISGFGAGKGGRRDFLRGGAALATGVVCAPLFPGVAYADDGEVVVLTWEGFTKEDELAAQLSEAGVSLQISTISTQDDVHTRLIGSTPTRLDLAPYNQGYADFYGKELNILTPIDEASLPNYNAEDIFDPFYNKPTWYWDETLYGVPMAWGLNTLVYNPALVPTVTSYEDLLKPEFAGLVTFAEDTIATWPMIARVAGYGDKFPNLTTEELDDAFAKAGPYREQSRLFAGSIGDAINLFVNGEIGVLFCGWSGIPLETGAQGVETISVVPKEGAAMWVDAWFVPKSAENREGALEYINVHVGAEGQAAMANGTSSGPVNKKAVALLNETTANLFDYDNLDEVFAKSPLQGIPPRESDEFATFDEWVTKWEEFKLGF